MLHLLSIPMSVTTLLFTIPSARSELSRHPLFPTERDAHNPLIPPYHPCLLQGNKFGVIDATSDQLPGYSIESVQISHGYTMNIDTSTTDEELTDMIRDIEIEIGEWWLSEMFLGCPEYRSEDRQTHKPLERTLTNNANMEEVDRREQIVGYSTEPLDVVSELGCIGKEWETGMSCVRVNGWSTVYVANATPESKVEIINLSSQATHDIISNKPIFTDHPISNPSYSKVMIPQHSLPRPTWIVAPAFAVSLLVVGSILFVKKRQKEQKETLAKELKKKAGELKGYSHHYDMSSLSSPNRTLDLSCDSVVDDVSLNTVSSSTTFMSWWMGKGNGRKIGCDGDGNVEVQV